MRLLSEQSLECPAGEKGTLEAFTSGSVSALTAGFATLLGLHPRVTQFASAGS
jgi:hypothetical protein